MSGSGSGSGWLWWLEPHFDKPIRRSCTCRAGTSKSQSCEREDLIERRKGETSTVKKKARRVYIDAAREKMGMGIDRRNYLVSSAFSSH